MAHQFNKYLLRAYYWPGTVLSVGTQCEQDGAFILTGSATVLVSEKNTEWWNDMGVHSRVSQCKVAEVRESFSWKWHLSKSLYNV